MVDGSLCNCLYFTSSRLSRVLTRMAEEEFRETDLFPSQALINENPGISQSRLSRELDLKPSTTSRFVDKLEHRGFVKRKVEGKSPSLHPTEEGLELTEKIVACWKNLFKRYSRILGEENGVKLTSAVHDAVIKLERDL